MDWLKLPPLKSLRAFAVVAETGSFTSAAARLSVTHAAVSQQVKLLEARLGVQLATRFGRGVRLTTEGEALARDLALGFAAIDRGVERVAETAADRPVQITTSPAFVSKEGMLTRRPLTMKCEWRTNWRASLRDAAKPMR